jgi:phage gpG-like protein
VSIADLARRLGRLDLAAVRQAALAAAAETIAEQVRAALSQPAGADHGFRGAASSPSPSRRQTGALADSIGVSAEADEALVGSTSEVARDQELGTARVPPRPFFAVIAATEAEAAAAAVGAAVADAIRSA